METLKRIRELRGGIYQELPVIALTANTVSGAREMFRNEGFTEFVPKPIERTVLERVLRKVLPKGCIQYGAKPAGSSLPEDGEHEEKAPEPEEAKEGGVIPEPASRPEEPALPQAPAEPDLPEEPEADDLPGEPAEAEAPDLSEILPDGLAFPRDRLAGAGINLELGLDYCGGEEGFYREMLRIFCAQSAGKQAELSALYESANWPDYAVKVHALKSTSLTIGAEALSAQAKHLEMAGKRGDEHYIHAHHAELMRGYRELCAQIAGA